MRALTALMFLCMLFVVCAAVVYAIQVFHHVGQGLGG